mgnify:CR=1 FL=1
MPTVLREAGYRLYFYSHEPNEPAHVHADKGGASVKIWLTPVSVAGSTGMVPRDLSEAVRLVREHRDALMEAWHGYFGAQG